MITDGESSFYQEVFEFHLFAFRTANCGRVDVAGENLIQIESNSNVVCPMKNEWIVQQMINGFVSKWKFMVVIVYQEALDWNETGESPTLRLWD